VGFILLPILGVAGTMHIAAPLSGAAGLVAFLLRTETGPRPSQPSVPVGGARRVIAIYTASGFLGLVAKVAFTRSLVAVFGSTTHAFSTILAVFLLGIATRGAIGTSANRNYLRKLKTTVTTTAAVFSLSTLLVYFLPRLYLKGHLGIGSGFGAGLLLRFVLLTIVLLPGAIGLGIAFPLAEHGLPPVASAAGRTNSMQQTRLPPSSAPQTLFLPGAVYRAVACGGFVGVNLVQQRPCEFGRMLCWATSSDVLVDIVAP